MIQFLQCIFDWLHFTIWVGNPPALAPSVSDTVPTTAEAEGVHHSADVPPSGRAAEGAAVPELVPGGAAERGAGAQAAGPGAGGQQRAGRGAARVRLLSGARLPPEGPRHGR